MLTLGVDLAAQPENTAACLVEWTSDSAEVREIRCTVNDAAFLELLCNSDKVGIDVPLGWPTDFVHAISQHLQFLPWPVNETRPLRYRETDLFVAQQTGRWPLSVSTDRIGVPAMRAAALMSRMDEQVDRAGTGKVVEVYPAAALCRWGFDSRGYKKNKGKEKRQALVEDFLRRTEGWLRLSTAQQQDLAKSDDSFDAVICALVARASAIGRTEPVPKRIEDRVRSEGWIALPLPDSLDELTAEG